MNLSEMKISYTQFDCMFELLCGPHAKILGPEKNPRVETILCGC